MDMTPEQKTDLETKGEFSMNADQLAAHNAEHGQKETVVVQPSEIGSLDALGFVDSEQAASVDIYVPSVPVESSAPFAAGFESGLETVPDTESELQALSDAISETEPAALAAAETAALPRVEDNGGLITIIGGLGSASNPHGTLDPTKRFHWIGRDIMGIHTQGSADDTAACYADSAKVGAAMCEPRANPDFVESEPVEAPKVESEEYLRGWADADAAYQDLKALIQNFAAIQAAETNDDADQKYPFVAYVRHNR